MNRSDDMALITICCIAYNQQDFIGKALESFLMQRTNFKFEVIVHDDASTDRTAHIIKEYATNFPDIIKPILQTENKYTKEGLNFQFKYVFPYVKTKYIAFCEGDDFWIDPLKLQKQVDFLENNIEYGLVHTKAVKFSEKDGSFGKVIGSECINFESLIHENTIVNLTVCLRNDLFKKYIQEVRPEIRSSWTTCDFPIWLWFIKHTKFKFLNEVTGVYRILETSICHHKNDEKRLNFHEGLNDILDYYLAINGSESLEKKIRAKYTSKMIKMAFLAKRRASILRGIIVFYEGKDWLNLVWIFITLPFFFSRILVKCSYYMRNKIFNKI